jgi:hypothetical protein
MTNKAAEGDVNNSSEKIKLFVESILSPSPPVQEGEVANVSGEGLKDFLQSLFKQLLNQSSL